MTIMRKILLLLITAFLFLQCRQERIRRNFFSELKGYPDFTSSKGNLPLFGFDSLTIDSLSTSIEGTKYWYMNTAKNSLFNINGFLRSSNKIVYIKTGDKDEAKSNKEQMFFNFSGDSTKSWVLHYDRDNVKQTIELTKKKQFFNQLTKDSVFIFTAIREQQNTSFSKEFLVQASLKKGFVSFRYIDRPERRLYTIDYLPSASVMYDSISVPLYPVQ